MDGFLLYKPNGQAINVDQNLTVYENEGMYLFRFDADADSSLEQVRRFPSRK